MVPPRRFVTAQLVIGLVVLTVGTVFLLDNLGYPVGGLLYYWPAVLVVVGAAGLLKARSMPGALGDGLLILAGGWLLATRLGYIDRSFWWALRTYWPLLLVAVGISTIWGALTRPGRIGAVGVDSSDVVSAAAFLGGVKRVIGSTNFKGGEATAVLGGVELDLRDARASGQPVFDIFAMFGGVELRIPENWAVDIRITPVLGGVEDSTRPVTDPAAPRLVLRGTVVMGGVEVKN